MVCPSCGGIGTRIVCGVVLVCGSCGGGDNHSKLYKL